MEFTQWKVDITDKESKTSVAFRFHENERNAIDKFDDNFSTLAEKYGFTYKDGTASHISEDISEVLNMSMKMFEIYLTLRNR